LFGDAKDFFADGGGERDCRVIEEFDLEIGRRAPCRGETGNADKGDVDAVNGSAGHHAEDEHGFVGHEWVKGIFNTESAENPEKKRQNAWKEAMRIGR